jgi:hypothetical protein
MRLHGDKQVEAPIRAASVIGLAEELRGLGASLRYTSDGRYTTSDLNSSSSVIRVVAPMAPHELAALLITSSTPIIVLDRRVSCAPSQVAAMFSSGASAYVPGPSVRLLLARIDAMRELLDPVAPTSAA